MNTTTPVPFDDVFISLQGPGFSLMNNFLQDSFILAARLILHSFSWVEQFLQFPSGFFELRSINYEVATMPEPGTWFLLGTGLAGLGAWRRMKRL